MARRPRRALTRLVTMARRRPEITSTARAVPVADPADPRITTGRAGPVVRRATARADPAVPEAVPRTMARVDPAETTRGAGTHSVATSTGPRGATGPHRGDGVHRRGRPGADHSRGLAARGSVARSTTTATRKRPSGIPCSTSLVSISSASGFRCKDLKTPQRVARLVSRPSGRSREFSRRPDAGLFLLDHLSELIARQRIDDHQALGVLVAAESLRAAVLHQGVQRHGIGVGWHHYGPDAF